MSDDNIHVLPPRDKRPPLLVGPFEYHKVVVQGRAVPGLTGHPRKDGGVTLVVDDRFIGDFPDQETAGQAAWLIAQAMAIASGYSHLEATNKDMPFAPIIQGVEFVETGDEE